MAAGAEGRGKGVRKGVRNRVELAAKAVGVGAESAEAAGAVIHFA